MLEIYLFGNVELKVKGEKKTQFPTRKSRSIFGYLVIAAGKDVSRELLSTECWGESSDRNGSSRKALNTELWRVRQALCSCGLDPRDYLRSDSDTVAFKPSVPCWVDVHIFENQLNNAMNRLEQADVSPVDEIEKSLELYRGDLMQDCYDDWCDSHRWSLRKKRMNALESLFQYRMNQENWRAALALGQKLLYIDPLMEHVHCDMMRCHFRMGNRPGAVVQYKCCIDILKTELGIDPMPETQQTYHDILAHG